MLSSNWKSLRKFESLFYKIEAFFHKTCTCVGLQAEQIYCVYIIHIFPWWLWLLQFHFYVISKLHVPWWKDFEIIFAAFYLHLHELKKCVRFLKFYFKVDISRFLFLAMSFLVDMFNLKTPFLTKKQQR